jgi:threonine aldolase
VDIFYIGGTKNGALFGEAVVIANEGLSNHYRYSLKQRGALMAKGAVLGIQFVELFKDGLYMELARHANLMAEKLVEIFKSSGVNFKAPPQTNMIFPILPLSVIERLEEKFDFYRWSDEGDNKYAIRLLTSWATREEDVDAFGRLLASLYPN